MSILNTQTWTSTDEGSTTKTITFSFSPTSGSLLIVFVTAPASFTTPSGWTLEKSVLGGSGTYFNNMYSKVSDGTEVNFSWTQNGARLTAATVYELSSGTTIEAYTTTGSDYVAISNLATADNRVVGPLSGNKIILEHFAYCGEAVTPINVSVNSDVTVDHLVNLSSPTSEEVSHLTAHILVPDGLTRTVTWSVVNHGAGNLLRVQVNDPVNINNISSSPGSLSFSLSSSSTDDQTISVSTTDASGATISAASDSAWLTVAPASGSEPLDFTVTVDTTALVYETYLGNITLSAAGYDDKVIPVTLNYVDPAQKYSIWHPNPLPNATAPNDLQVNLGTRFTVSALSHITSVWFYKHSSTPLPTVTFNVTNEGTSELLRSGTLTLPDPATTGWIEIPLPYPVQLSPGTNYLIWYNAPASFDYTFSAGAFTSPITNGIVTAVHGAFLYGGSAIPTNSGGTGSYGIDVEVYSGPAPLSIITSETEINGFALAGDTTQVTFSVETSSGLGETITVSESEPWMSIAPASGAEPLTFTVTLDAMGLTESDNIGQITVSAPGYADVVLPVSFVVYGSTTTSIWQPGAYPSVTTGNDGVPYSLGTLFTFAKVGLVLDLHWYKSNSNFKGATTVYISEAPSGLVVGSGTATPGLASGWITFTLDNPVEVRPGQNYVVWSLTPGEYTLSVGLFASPRTSGDVTASAGVVSQTTSPIMPGSTTQNGYGYDLSYVAAPPKHELTSDISFFNLNTRIGDVTTRYLDISTLDQTDATVTATASAAWITVNPPSGTEPLTFSLIINPADVAIGSYSESITFSAAGYADLVVPLNINVVDPATPNYYWYPSAYPNAVAPSDPNNYNFGTKFSFDIPGVVSSIGFYKASSSPIASLTVYISNNKTAELLATQTFTPADAAGWNTINLDTPLEVNDTDTYLVWMYWDGADDYTFSNNLFSTAQPSAYFIRPRGGALNVAQPDTPLFPTSNSIHGFGFDIGFLPNLTALSLSSSVPFIQTVIETGSTQSVQTLVHANDSSGATITASSQESWINILPTALNDPATFTIEIDATALATGSYFGTAIFSSQYYDDAVVPVSIEVVASGVVENLFYPTYSAGAVAANDGASYLLGNRFAFSQGGYISQLLFYKKSTQAMTPKTLYLYDTVASQVIASASVTPSTQAGWSIGSISQTAVVSGRNYVVYALFTATEQYTADQGLTVDPEASSGSITMNAGLYSPYTGTVQAPTTVTNYGYGFDITFATAAAPEFITTTKGLLRLTAESTLNVADAITVGTSDEAVVSISQTDDAAWLTITPSSGNSPLSLSIFADAGLLSENEYTATITVTAVGYPDLEIPVIFTVVPLVATTNVITDENDLAGGLGFGFDLAGAADGDVGYLGFAKSFSVNAGDTIEFCVDRGADNTDTDIGIYRIGRYSGSGGRLHATITNNAINQPAGVSIANSNGGTSMSNWQTSASWAVPADTVSGLFIAVVRDSGGAGRSWIPFVVRNDNRYADIVFVTPDSTWGAAYNFFGNKGTEKAGASVYGSGGPLGGTGPRAYAVSYDRPIITRGNIVNHWDVLDLPLIEWIEDNGFNVKYIGSYDLDQQHVNDVLGTSKVLLSVGHDEYWSSGMRNNAIAFRNSGRNLIFFSGNEVFWKIRWADNGRTFWCYKDTLNNGVQMDPVEWTGTWKDTRWAQRKPEYLLTGDTFRMNGINNKTMTVDAASYGSSPFWRDTSVELGTDLIVPEVIGFEANSHMPPDTGAVRLAQTTHNIDGSYADDNGQTYSNLGELDWSPTMFYASPTSGITVGFGTCQWQWGLSNRHELGSKTSERVAMRQATLNLFYDLGCRAMSLQGDLIEPTAVPLSSYGVTYTGINSYEPATGIGGFKIGANDLQAMRVGSAPVTKAYRGSVVVYDSGA